MGYNEDHRYMFRQTRSDYKAKPNLIGRDMGRTGKIDILFGLVADTKLTKYGKGWLEKVKFILGGLMRLGYMSYIN